MTDELSLLQTLRLKGRPTLEQIVAALSSDAESVEANIGRAIEAEHCVATGKGYKLTPSGRQRLVELLTAEREALDQRALTELYDQFHQFNSNLKALITAWQMKAPDVPNDHTDAEYDRHIVERLASLHDEFVPWLDRLAAVNPRMARYSGRFKAALAAVRSGDHSFIAKPLDDSYHTVWFELHEELIGMLGRDRESEAAAGRAV